MPNPFLHISTFFRSIKIRSCIRTPTPHIHASTHLGRRHAASWIWTTPAELLNGSWRFVRVLVLSVHQGRSVWKSHSFKKKCVLCDRVNLKESQFVRYRKGKKHIQCIYSYIHASHRKEKQKRQTNPTIIMTILEAFYLKPCESTDNGLWVCKYTLAIPIHHHSPSVENSPQSGIWQYENLILYLSKHKQYNIRRKLQRT